MVRTTRWRRLWLACSLAACFGMARGGFADEVLFLGAGAEWQYLPGLAEASSPDPTAWRQPAFDDSQWATGNASFGYGADGPHRTDLSQVEPSMQGNYSSLFLRRTFEVPEKEALSEFHAGVLYDDGFILWINGIEVARSLVAGDPGGFVPFDTTARLNHNPLRFEDFPLQMPADYLISGTNTVAVQVFNANINGDDLTFDLELFDPVGPDVVAPEVVETIPVPGTAVSSLAEVEISFDEAVIGVDASDLLIGGLPADSVTGSGPGPYIFSFQEPAPGETRLEWAAGHGITDASVAQNPFIGGSWINILIDSTVPVVNLVITEFLAANGDTLQDEDGDDEDWIEVFNSSSQPVDLVGIGLTDDPRRPGLWTFPGTVLGAREYLIVFASGKDRRQSGMELHTNFKLSDSGEYLGIYGAELPRQVLHEFAPQFPEQRVDTSYGLTANGKVGYFVTPTPGEPNLAGEVASGFAADVRFGVERGFYDQAFTLELTTLTAGADIYYTLNGSSPTVDNAFLYDGPFEVSGRPEHGVVTVRAVAFADGLLPSRVATHSYFFADNILSQSANPSGFPPRWGNTPADYELDPQIIQSDDAAAREGVVSIPSLSVVTDIDHLFGRLEGIYANPSQTGSFWEQPVSTELLFADGREGFQIDCGLRIQGGSSTIGWKAKKLSMRLLFKRDYGAAKLHFSLFPDYDVTEFNTLVLDAGLNLTLNHPDHDQRIRSQYVRDAFIADLQNAAGGYGPRTIFVNLYLNGLYWGLYGLHERPDADFAAANFGGSAEEYDVLRHGTDTVLDGDVEAYLEMLRRSRAVSGDVAGYLAVQEYLAARNLIDYVLVNFYGGNTDWDHHNWYATRRRVAGGQFRFHSWDAEHVLKDVRENSLGIDNAGAPTGVFYDLMDNQEFRLLVGDRIHKHFFNGGILYVDPLDPAWDPDEPQKNMPASLYMRRIEEIRTAVALEYARWGDVQRAESYTREDWLEELSALRRSYFPERSERVLQQLRASGLYPSQGTPIFNQHGGPVEPGYLLIMSLPARTDGAIYYTLESQTLAGGDPRVFGSGGVSPAATVYSGAVALNEDVVVRARSLSVDGKAWSALTEARFTLADSVPLEGKVIPGDISADGKLNLVDVTSLLGHLFRSSDPPLPCGEALLDPGNRALVDSNGDGQVDAVDAIYLLRYLFLKGPPHVLGHDCVVLPDCADFCD